MADSNRKSEPKANKTETPKAAGPVQLSPEELRKIAGGASVPPPSPQPDGCMKK
jgi:hypothetical protein